MPLIKLYQKGKVLVFFLLIFIFSIISCSDSHHGISDISDLKCDYRENPLGIESAAPGLSWLLHSSERGQKQTGYQILVSGSLEKLNDNKGDVWDSRKVKSGESVHIRYQGKPLESRGRYYWKVRVWDKTNRKSDWSVPAYWEMGLTEPDDWKAQWIGFDSESAPLFRKEFDVTKSIRDARVYISGLGYYELSINGSRVGDHVLDPGQTDYEQRTFYVIYDVTDYLKEDRNVIGIMLGDGWYHQAAVNHGKYGWKDVVYGIPRLIFQMYLTYSDGSQKTIVSDDTWTACPGPVIFNNIYAGEHYDARLETQGWDTHEFDDSNWRPAGIVEGPGGKLIHQNIPPIKKIKSITPVNISNPRPGVFVYDMGQNFTGWAKLKLNAERGTEIQLRFAEWLDEEGMIDPGSTGYYATGVVQTDKYICKGDGVEIWEPRFTYHGFQYVEMTGFPGTPGKENLEGIVVHTALESAGEFECSEPMINKLHTTGLWTLTGNLHSIPTDCPHRERCGWLGDAFLISDMTNYNFDAALFWAKFIEDIETSRRGDIPTNIAPGRRLGGRDPDWGAAFIQLPWSMVLYYNDKSIIQKHYDGMMFFMDYLQNLAEDYIIYKGIGSLFPPGRIMPKEMPKEFSTTVLFYYCSEIMGRMSEMADKNDDAVRFVSLSERIKSAFNEKFYDTSEKTYGGQEKNTLALAFGLVPDNDGEAVAQNLNRYVMEDHNGHVSTGIFGSRYIYQVLGEYGYDETIKQIFAKDTFPGYGYLFSRGANTFWENWGELTFEDRDIRGDERSKSHPFQGAFTAWFYNGIAGINPDPDRPGFKHIIFKPQLINILDWASAKYNSIHGMITSKWENTRDQFVWVVSVPVNASATVYLPTDRKDSVMEGEIPAYEAKGVKFLKVENGQSVFEIGSGEYSFTIHK